VYKYSGVSSGHQVICGAVLLKVTEGRSNSPTGNTTSKIETHSHDSGDPALFADLLRCAWVIHRFVEDAREALTSETSEGYSLSVI